MPPRKITNLPNNSLREILGHVSLTSIAKFGAASKQFAKVAREAGAKSTGVLASRTKALRAELSAALVPGLTKLMYAMVRRSLSQRRSQSYRKEGAQVTLLRVPGNNMQIRGTGSMRLGYYEITISVAAPAGPNQTPAFTGHAEIDGQSRLTLVRASATTGAVATALRRAIAQYNREPVVLPAWWDQVIA